MTPEEAARIVRQTTFPRSTSLDGMVETIEAFGIHLEGLSREDGRARAEGYRAAIKRAPGI
jgi:hypothetical protein